MTIVQTTARGSALTTLRPWMRDMSEHAARNGYRTCFVCTGDDDLAPFMREGVVVDTRTYWESQR
jgi:hypothetical protein